MTKLILTCNPGTEDIVYNEAKNKLNARLVEYSKGRVIIEIEGDLDDAIYNLKSIHGAYMLLASGNASSGREFLEKLKDKLRDIDFHKYVTPYMSFAIRAERAGTHDFTSLDIARVSGEVVIEEVRRKLGRRPLVDLDKPSVVIRVDVIFDKYYVGLALSGEKSLHRRGYRVVDHPAALKPSLAYVLLMLSKSKKNDVILDPMCGCGTIAIEAALEIPDVTIYCMDINKRYIEGARINALAAGVPGIRFIVGDARRLTSHFSEESVDRIISNPPYGIRLSDPFRVKNLYRSFIKEAYSILKNNGTLTLITTEYSEVERAGKNTGFKLIHERFVAHGSLWAKILVFEKHK